MIILQIVVVPVGHPVRIVTAQLANDAAHTLISAFGVCVGDGSIEVVVADISAVHRGNRAKFRAHNAADAAANFLATDGIWRTVGGDVRRHVAVLYGYRRYLGSCGINISRAEDTADMTADSLNRTQESTVGDDAVAHGLTFRTGQAADIADAVDRRIADAVLNAAVERPDERPNIGFVLVTADHDARLNGAVADDDVVDARAVTCP